MTEISREEYNAKKGLSKVIYSLRYRFGKNVVFKSRMKIRKEIKENEREKGEYLAYKNKFIECLIEELKGCASVLIEVNATYKEEFSKLLEDPDFKHSFFINEKGENRYLISYMSLAKI